jgi:L-lactate utilization protein LutC
MSQYDTVANDVTIETTVKALEANGFSVTVVENAEAAKDAALAKLPKGGEVLTVTSKTVEKIGLLAAINESGDYDALRPKLNAMMDDETKKAEQRKLGAAPDHVVGSVHALTQDGRALIASATGSQLPAYTYGAGHVIWVVGGQKIVTDIEDAWQRLEQHVLPLEMVRAQEAYGMGTSINKVVVYNKEVVPGRVDIILVKESLGF